ncbi:hypothetical protein HRG_008408 [Hirsutella rhossiliensis]|uniref:Uncharacterized protein n=1 Tax=Hirsutella rhossiliensis TaxID=111463 RepID=A0A9P8MQ69_9HYPO|nr:uncharacterized protein HRG_08408 [Hirsutella rhossiliensis]KAH0960253.1 hypothetical protein HRG_08408 [Hirsutella rhossiliensis]
MAAWLGVRGLLDFPGGDNASDTVFAGVHLNQTTLRHWNYTYYSNETLSNGSHCFLTFAPYQPAFVYTNGSFVNATWCYVAIDHIGTRGYVGIGFAVLYGLALILSLTLLAKHGARYLPVEKRFYPIGRRWQWYWGCFVCACALVSLISNVDIDRYYLQELPIVLAIFFWFLLCQGTLALTWEAVRHWGSWLERQFIDPNPFVYRIDDRRAQVEFWLPLWFYFWVWLNFFLVVPRNWTFVELQRSPEQIRTEAIPAATGTRFKAGAFCLVIAWLTIVFSLHHSIRHYKPRHRGLWNRGVGLMRAVPLRFALILPLCLALIAYQAFMSFAWEFSIIKYDGMVPVIFAWGYGPSVLILYIQIAYGYASPNEDKELMRQRRERGEMVNRELGIVKQPAWWRRVRGDHLGTLRDKIKRNVDEVGGERGVGRRVEDDMERHARQEAERSALDNDGIELGRVARGGASDPRVDRAGVGSVRTSMRYPGKSDRRHTDRILETAAGVLFPNDADGQRAQRAAHLTEDVDGVAPPPYSNGERHRSETRTQMAGPRTNSTSTTNSTSAPPQQVRSMLDV